MSQQGTVQQLREHLRLDETHIPDDDISVVVQQLLLWAKEQDASTMAWDRLQAALVATGTVSYVDVFAAIPILLPLRQDGALRLLDLIATECSAKELVIALQETTERLCNEDLEDEEDDDDDDEIPGPSSSAGSKPLKRAAQTVRLINLYAKVIPRLKPGKQTAADIADPLLKDLDSLVVSIGADTGCELETLQTISSLNIGVWDWADRAGAGSATVKSLLLKLSMSTVEAAQSNLGIEVAKAAFIASHPRLRMPGRTTDTQSLNAVEGLWASLQHTGINVSSFESNPSIGSLTILAHIPGYTPSLDTAQNFLPIFIVSLTENTALPSTLAFLLKLLASLKSNTPHTELMDSFALPLIHILLQVSSTHPDPEMRHFCFRVLSGILALSPTLLRMDVLRDTMSVKGECPPPMRVAVVGLLKEAVLEALASPEPNVFASQAFAETFVPLLFRAYLPSNSRDPEEVLRLFLESPEPRRLVEALNLLYVLLQRDRLNKTGIHSPETIEAMQQDLIQPLKQRLTQWESVDVDDDEEVVMCLRSLQMGLDLVAGVKSELS